MVLAASAHQAGAHGGHAYAHLPQLGVQAFGEPGQRKLCPDIWQKMGYRNLSADGGDVDDCSRTAAHHVRHNRLDCMQRGKVRHLHGSIVGVDGLIAERTYFNDGCIVDQDIHSAEHLKSLFDDARCLLRIGDVRNDELDIVLVGHVSTLKQFLASLLEFLLLACRQNELNAGAPKLVRHGQPQTTRPAGDNGYLSCYHPRLARHQRVGEQRPGKDRSTPDNCPLHAP